MYSSARTKLSDERGIFEPVAAGARTVAAWMRDAVAEVLAALLSQPEDTAATDEQRRQVAAREAQVLRQAAHANSPHEVDWLLYAAMMTDPNKRRYCLERALAINPDSEVGARALAELGAAPATPERPSQSADSLAFLLA